MCQDVQVHSTVLQHLRCWRSSSVLPLHPRTSRPCWQTQSLRTFLCRTSGDLQSSCCPSPWTPARLEAPGWTRSVSLWDPGCECLMNTNIAFMIYTLIKFLFFSLKKLVARPRLPILPVLPILCTYSSMSLGMSKLMTCFTLGMSRPRAATAVATMMGVWPHLNLKVAC